MDHGSNSCGEIQSSHVSVQLLDKNAIRMNGPMNVYAKLDGLGPRGAHDHYSANSSTETSDRPHKGHRKPQRDQAFQAKERNCLMCGSRFQSSWPGERICKRCKESATWRSG